jgi:hypothetical protein
MVRCNVCGLKIKQEDLDKVYQVSYGELKDRKYVSGKNNTLYYHIQCFDDSNSDRKKVIMVSEEI